MIAYELSTHGQQLVKMIEEARDAGDTELLAGLEAMRDSMLAEDDGAPPAQLLAEMKRDVLELEAQIAGHELLRDRMERQIQHKRKAVKIVTETALMYLQARGLTVVDTEDAELGKVRRQKNGGLAPLWVDPELDPSALPSRFLKPQPPKLDTGEIRGALAAGESYPWARIEERGEHVRWDG